MRAVLMMTCLLITFGSWANPNPRKIAAETAEKNLASITVYWDVNLFSRKKLAAKNMTELHQAFNDQGYDLLTINPYTENSDLQGFFISYKKRR